MLRKPILIILLCLSFVSTVFLTQAQTVDPAPALKAVLADLSQQLGGSITLDQLSHYSYVERLTDAGVAQCPQSAVLYPNGNEHVWSISVSYHGTVFRYFAVQNGSQVVRCGSVAATLTPTFTPSATHGPTYTPSPSPSPTMTSTATTCTGFMTSRLFIGDQAEALAGNTLNLRAGPNATSPLIRKVYANVPFTVVAGPVCEPATNRAWWQVNYNDNVGWLIEGEGSDFFVTSLVTREPPPATVTPTTAPTLIQPTVAPISSTLQAPTELPGPSLTPPYTVTPTPDACSGGLPFRLIEGGYGRVTPGDPSNLRTSASVNGSTVIRKLYSSIVFTVISGPDCDGEGRTWWQIRYNDSIGWAAESDSTSYFLEPAP